MTKPIIEFIRAMVQNKRKKDKANSAKKSGDDLSAFFMYKTGDIYIYR